MGMKYIGAAIGAVWCVALATAPANAGTTSATASVDATTDTNSRADGLPSSAAVSGNGSASAISSLGAVHVIGADIAHFSVGAPGSNARSVFSFTVLGATGTVALDFNFVPLGQWNFGTGAYAVNGGFSALLDSLTGPSPYKEGSFVSVQFGSRIDQGGIRTTSDRFSVAPSSVPWLGESISPFTLSSSFMGGGAAAGTLALEATGGSGNANYDFSLVLASITSPTGLRGIKVVADTGQVFNVGGAVPEPASWALMVGGFGLVGGAMRRMRRSVAHVA